MDDSTDSVLIVEIVFGKNRSDQISVKLDDDPVQLAQVFENANH
jgi:hypothetical protein